MAYRTKFTNHWLEEIDIVDNAQTFIDNHSNIVEENTFDRTIGGVTTSFARTLHKTDEFVENILTSDFPTGEDTIIFNDRRIIFEGADTDDAPGMILGNTAGRRIYICNSEIWFNYTGTGEDNFGLNSTGTITDAGVVGGGSSARVFGLINCRIIFDLGGSSVSNSGKFRNSFNHAEGCTFIFLSDAHRNDWKFTTGGIIDDLNVEGATLTDESVSGFRFVPLVIAGELYTFRDYSSSRLGVTINGGGAFVLASEFLIGAGAPHQNNTAAGAGNSFIRNSSSTGIIMPSPRIDLTVKDAIFGTGTADKAFSQHAGCVHWDPRYYKDANFTEPADGVMALVDTQVDYDNPGTGTADDSGMKGIKDAGTKITYEWSTDSEGYFAGTKNIAGITDDNATNQFSNVYIPIRVTHLSDTAQNGQVNTQTQWNQSSQISVRTYETDIIVVSPFGSVNEARTYNESDDYFGADSDYTDGDLVFSRIEASQKQDQPDTGMTHYSGDDRAAQTTAVKGKFGSSSDVTINDIASLYKIAISERTTDINNFLKVDDSSTWDISSNDVNNIKLDSSITDEYTVDSDTFIVKAVNIVEETSANFNVNSMKVNILDLNQGTIIDIEVIADSVINVKLFDTAPDNPESDFSIGGSIDGKIMIADSDLPADTTKVLVFSNEDITSAATIRSFAAGSLIIVNGAEVSLSGGDDFQDNVLDLFVINFTIRSGDRVTLYDITNDSDITHSNLADKKINSSAFESDTTVASNGGDFTEPRLGFYTGNIISKILVVGTSAGRNSFIQEVNTNTSGTFNIDISTVTNTSYSSNAAETGTITTSVGTSSSDKTENKLVMTTFDIESLGDVNTNRMLNDLRANQDYRDVLAISSATADFIYPVGTSDTGLDLANCIFKTTKVNQSISLTQSNLLNENNDNPLSVKIDIVVMQGGDSETGIVEVIRNDTPNGVSGNTLENVVSELPNRIFYSEAYKQQLFDAIPKPLRKASFINTKNIDGSDFQPE